MCQNEYRSSDRIVKINDALEVDSNTSVLAQLELISKHLAAFTLSQANLIQVQALRCDFCREGHANNLCSKTYNPSWKDHPNFKWRHD